MTPQGNLDVANQGEGVAPPISSNESEQSLDSTTGRKEGISQDVLTDEQLSQVDLTQPEGLKQFRSAYQQRKYEAEEAARERDEIRNEHDRFRGTVEKNVYLRTDVPIEDFKPAEVLQKMSDEEPEYHDSLVQEVLETHFWDNLPTFFEDLQGKILDVENNENDRIITDQLNNAWDVMARRLTAGEMDGTTTFVLLTGLRKNPELARAVWAVANGQPMPVINGGNSGGYQSPVNQPGQGYSQGGYQQPGQQSLPTPEQVAAEFGLDLSEQGHRQFVQKYLYDEQQRRQERQAFQNTQGQLQASINQLNNQLKQVKDDQSQIQGISDQEADRRADAELSSILNSGLDEYIKKEYSSAIPKDKPELANTIKILARESLVANPDYGQATATARKFFKQAVRAKSQAEQERAKNKGLDALAVVAVYRRDAVEAAASSQLGTVRRDAARLAKRREVTASRRELPTGGNPAPPAPRREPIDTTDMSAAKARIKQRFANANAMRGQ